MTFSKKLGIVAHVPHWVGIDGRPQAYEPYVREIRIWANLFSKVEIFAPPGEGEIRGNLAPYECENVIWTPINYSLAEGMWSPFKRLAQVPGLIWALYRLIIRSDLIHLRSPSHFTLFGYPLVRLLRRQSITKWAGLFGDFAQERWPSRIERWMVNLPAPQNPILIYGPSQHEHQVSFLPALMSKEELSLAQTLSLAKKNWQPPWNLLSVGRLTNAKGFDLALKGLGEFNRLHPAVDWQYTLVGDGVELDALRQIAKAEGLEGRVRFTGAASFTEAQQYYAKAHVVIMPGILEGWPKPIAEAWAHNAIPLAASAGLVPWILRSGDVGELFDPTPQDLAAKLDELLKHPEHMRRITSSLYKKADELSLESFQSRLEEVLVTRLEVM